MDNKVVGIGCTTLHPIPVERILDAAKHLEYVLIIGYEPDGKPYVACSEGDLAKATYAAQKFITEVHTGKYGDDTPRTIPT